jgi:hypothetical protein
LPLERSYQQGDPSCARCPSFGDPPSHQHPHPARRVHQRLFGSQRALKTVEDFTEFEQRGAYFDGDDVIAAKKGVNILERGHQVNVMAEFQAMLGFPPAPKLDVLGKLDPDKATPAELRRNSVLPNMRIASRAARSAPLAVCWSEIARQDQQRPGGRNKPADRLVATAAAGLPICAGAGSADCNFSQKNPLIVAGP